ncbi:MAG: hypothetical protein GC191_19360 [Azospirillum sp.]|nr:hypothetical protein [Azospirillum sp.]
MTLLSNQDIRRSRPARWTAWAVVFALVTALTRSVVLPLVALAPAPAVEIGEEAAVAAPGVPIETGAELSAAPSDPLLSRLNRPLSVAAVRVGAEPPSHPPPCVEGVEATALRGCGNPIAVAVAPPHATPAGTGQQTVRNPTGPPAVPAVTDCRRPTGCRPASEAAA